MAAARSDAAKTPRAHSPSGSLFLAAGCLSIGVGVVLQDNLLGADNEALAYLVWLRVNGR